MKIDGFIIWPVLNKYALKPEKMKQPKKEIAIINKAIRLRESKFIRKTVIF